MEGTVKEFIMQRSDIKMFRSKFEEFGAGKWSVSYMVDIMSECYASPAYVIHSDISIKRQITSHINGVGVSIGEAIGCNVLIKI